MIERVVAALLAVSATLGCAAAPALLPGVLGPSGEAPGGALVLTTTQLSQDNYRIVRSGVEGESQGLVVLFFFSLRSASLTQAVSRLYEAAGLEAGSPWALAHWVQEYQRRSFLLFALPRVRVRADVVEFVGAAGMSGAPAPVCPGNSGRPPPLDSEESTAATQR